MPIILEQVVMIGNELAISFAEGEELYLPLAGLRHACPCAVCQGEPDALGRVLRPKVEHGEKAFELSRFEVVGGYALQLFWADGHSSGIYSFPYLIRCGQLLS